MNPNRDVDFYVAPTLGYAHFSRDEDPFAFGLGDGSKSEGKLAWGGAVGADVPLGEGLWVFSASLRFLTAAFDDGDFDNVVTHVGFGRRLR